jgi:hypothetical protein
MDQNINDDDPYLFKFYTRVQYVLEETVEESGGETMNIITRIFLV